MDQPQKADPMQLIHDQPEFLLAIITALMDKGGHTHIHVTGADVKSAIDHNRLHLRSSDPNSMDLYLLSQDEHAGLDYANPTIPQDKEGLQ